jgi:hypothetical protein
MKDHLRLFIPHFFVKEPILEVTDPDLQNAIELVAGQPTLEMAMETALRIISNKYDSKRFETYIFFYKWFEVNPNSLWKRKGFLHCTQQNYLFRVLMVKSGYLNDEQIEYGYSLVGYISPHQFLKVHVGDRIIAVDPWNYNLGATLGKYATGFGLKSIDSK